MLSDHELELRKQIFLTQVRFFQENEVARERWAQPGSGHLAVAMSRGIAMAPELSQVMEQLDEGDSYFLTMVSSSLAQIATERNLTGVKLRNTARALFLVGQQGSTKHIVEHPILQEFDLATFFACDFFTLVDSDRSGERGRSLLAEC